MHESMEYLPQGEIQRRIDQGDAAVRAEMNGAMTELRELLGDLRGDIKLLIGTEEVPGAFQRVEASTEDIRRGQKDMQTSFIERSLLDDEFRKDITSRVATIEAKMRVVEMIAAVVTFVWAVMEKLGALTKGKDGEPSKGIIGLLSTGFALILYVAAVITWSKVVPMLQYDWSHHTIWGR
jgi:hypothetical protein